MKKIFKKENLIFLLTIILCTLIVIYFDIQKETYDGDELYTYTLSTSAKGGFMGGNFPLDTFNNPDIINESLTLQREELFDLRTIYYNQVNDVHPPLYYFLFHYISIFSFNKFSKWPGLILNLLIYLFTLFLVFSITKNLTNNKYFPFITTLVYGISNGAISTQLFIRMYMLLTMFCLLFIYLIIKLTQNKNNNQLFLLLTITTFLGFMTHYYFLVFAFIYSLIYFIYTLVKKRYSHLLKFSISVLSGVICGYIVFPASYNHLFNSYHDVSTSNNLIHSNIIYNLKSIYKRLNIELFYSILPVILILLLILIIYKIITKKHFNNPYIIYLTSGSIIYFLLVLKITPILSTRYIYNIYPIIEIVLCLLICNIIKNYKLPKIILTIIFIPLAYSNIFINEVSWCNQIPKEDTSVINTYKNYPYLYLANSDYDLTSKTFYARLFKEFYITYHIDEESINYITTYLKDNSYNGIVIDISNTIDQEKYLHEIASIMNYSKRIDTNLGIILESHP